jgi:UDP-N-acetylglucosamine 1-carboxyvinyltransferase
VPSIVIRGGRRLIGEIRVDGARNAALPLAAAALLASGVSRLHGVPPVGDVAAMVGALGQTGAEVVHEPQGTLVLDASGVARFALSDAVVRALRASWLLLGPLLGRFGRAMAPLPGVAELGLRPVDQHLKGFAALGARVSLSHGVVTVEAAKLRGATVSFDVPSVTATQNVLMAATLAGGRSTLENAAREPEVEELARVLNKMGARVHGAGTATIDVDGVAELQPFEHTLMPNRIEAGTLLVAAVLCRGDVLVRGADPEHLGPLLAQLRAAGVEVAVEAGGIGVRARDVDELKPLDTATQPYPGLATDLQPVLTVLMTQARGLSIMHETIFEHRFLHVPELQRLGADIHVDGRRAVVRGPSRLEGAPVLGRDLHGTAALVMAGLVADGETTVTGVETLDRGYHRLDRKLKALGADIRRAKGIS